MTWPQGGTPDPYQQNPYGQQPQAQPADPYGQQAPYQPYDQPTQAAPTSGQPTSSQPYSPAYPPTTPYDQPPTQYAQQPAYGTPAPYGAPAPYGYPPVQASPATNTMAILSLVFAFVFAPLAIVFGHMAKKQIKERGEGGDGLATAGLVMGYIFTSLSLIVCCIWGVSVFFIAQSAQNAGNGAGY